MCDTFIIQKDKTLGGKIFFGKNSDREPDEAQIIEIVPPKDHIPDNKLKTTYIEIPQVTYTYGIIISRPYWMWGAEMGVNEKGVAIGNEAIFTKLKKDRRLGLIGMDLLRLALERVSDRFEAVEVITSLLQKYGQYGPCGHRDKKLIYDNSFLIADGKGAIILELYGKEWAWKNISKTASISNIITFTTDYQQNSPGLGKNLKGRIINEDDKINIYRSYKDWLYSAFAGGIERKKLFKEMVETKSPIGNIFDVFKIMRSHSRNDFKPHKGSNRDLCMHAGGPLIRISQTASSFVVEYYPDGNFKVYATGTALPCTSFFIPVDFARREFIPGDIKPHGIYTQGSWWWEHEILNRMLIFRWSKFTEYREERNQLEKKYIKKLIQALSSQTLKEYLSEIRDFRLRWIEKLKGIPCEKTNPIFKYYWKRLSKLNELRKLI